jgi:hypothetical protein
MRRLRDYKCPDGHITELLVEDGSAVWCGCGKPSTAMISPVRIKLEGVTGTFPSAALRWAKQHERLGGPSDEYREEG